MFNKTVSSPKFVPSIESPKVWGSGPKRSYPCTSEVTPMSYSTPWINGGKRRFSFLELLLYDSPSIMHVIYTISLHPNYNTPCRVIIYSQFWLMKKQHLGEINVYKVNTSQTVMATVGFESSPRVVVNTTFFLEHPTSTRAPTQGLTKKSVFFFFNEEGGNFFRHFHLGIPWISLSDSEMLSFYRRNFE